MAYQQQLQLQYMRAQMMQQNGMAAVDGTNGEMMQPSNAQPHELVYSHDKPIGDSAEVQQEQ